MNKLKNWLEDKLFFLKTGIRVKTANGGRSTEQIVIRYKNFYFEIDFDAETGEPTGDFCWTEGTPITHVPIREFYYDKREIDNG